MPKTRDAFAFRDVIRGIELNERANVLAKNRCKKSKELYEIYEKAGDLLFNKFVSKDSKLDEVDRIGNIEQLIRKCDLDLVRADFLLERLKAHDKRLRKVMSRHDSVDTIFSRAFELQSKYEVVKEQLLFFIVTIRELKLYNSEVLRTAFNEELGVRLRLARRRKGYSQKEISEKLGIPKSTYSNYELGRREIPPLLIYRLVDILKVSTDYLLGIKK